MWLPTIVLPSDSTSIAFSVKLPMARLRIVDPSEPGSRSMPMPAGAVLPSISITGVDVHPGWVDPSISTVSTTFGSSATVGVMVQTPLSWPGSVVGMSNSIVSMSADALASSMAARSVHSPGVAVSQAPSPGFASPASPVVLTVATISTTTVSEFENSDVPAYEPAPRSSVAVAVRTSLVAPANDTVNASAPPPVCVTVSAWTRVSPSPKPLGSAPDGLVKNSTR